MKYILTFIRPSGIIMKNDAHPLNSDSVVVLFRLMVNIRPQPGALCVGSGILRYLNLS